MLGANPTSPPPLHIGSSTVTPNAGSQYIYGSQTLVPGGPPITALGYTYSLPLSATDLIIAGEKGISTFPFDSRKLQGSNPTPPPLITNSSTIAPNANSQHIYGTQTLASGGRSIVVSGLTYSILPSGTALFVAGKGGTTKFRFDSVGAPGASIPAVIGGQTSAAGENIITVNGRIISLLPGGVSAVVGGSAEGHHSNRVYATADTYNRSSRAYHRH